MRQVVSLLSLPPSLPASILKQPHLLCRLFYRTGDHLDSLFCTLAHSIVSGPLSKLRTPVIALKSATLPAADTKQGQVMCLYFLDFWSFDSAKSVLECLLREHGAMPSAAKADLLTYLEVDSKVSETLYLKATVQN